MTGKEKEEEEEEEDEIDLGMEFHKMSTELGIDADMEREKPKKPAEQKPCPVCGNEFVNDGAFLNHMKTNHPGYREGSEGADSVTVEERRERAHKDFNNMLKTILTQEKITKPDMEDLMDIVDLNFGMSDSFYTPEILYNVSSLIDNILQRYGMTDQKRRRILAKFHNRMSIKLRERQTEMAKGNIPISYQQIPTYSLPPQPPQPYQSPPAYPQPQNQPPPQYLQTPAQQYQRQPGTYANPNQPLPPQYSQPPNPPYPPQTPPPRPEAMTREEIYKLVNEKKAEDEKDRRLSALEANMAELIQVLKNKPADNKGSNELTKMAMDLVKEKLKSVPPPPPISADTLVEAIKTAVDVNPNTSRMSEWDAKVQSKKAEMEGKKSVAMYESEAEKEKAKQLRATADHFADTISEGLQNIGVGFGGKLANLPPGTKEELPVVDPVLDEKGKATGKYHFACKCGENVEFNDGEPTATCKKCKVVYQFAPTR